MKKGILIHDPDDDVGVAVLDLTAGEEIGVVTLDGKFIKQIKLINDILLGHKVAMRDLSVEKHIIEYGRPIGYAVDAISEGAHVHLHNIKSLRWAESKAKILQS